MTGEQKLLIATRNRGKVREYAHILEGLPLQLLSLEDVGIRDEVEEIGATFCENATLKALAYARTAGLLTLADDSGLVVEALGGEPGVYSSRYAGPTADDAERVRFLLDKLRDVPACRRAAAFICCIAVATPERLLSTFEGRVEGVIASEPRGSYGFGYDPIFFLPALARMMAELHPEEKDAISHRGKAGEQAREYLAHLARG